jgi:ATP-binding cassette subfamily B protein
MPLRQDNADNKWLLATRYLRPHLPYLLLLAFLFFTVLGLQFVNPLVVRRFIDMAVRGASVHSLFRTALLYLAIAIGLQVFGVAESYVSEYLGQRATNRMRVDLARHCLGLDMAFHKSHAPGEMIERIDGDTALLGNTFSRLAVSVLGNMLLLIAVLILFCRIDLRVGVPMTVVAVVGIFVAGRILGFATPSAEAMRQASADQYGFIEERLAGTEDIRACGAAGYTMRLLYPFMRTLYRKTYKAQGVGTLLAATPFLFFVLGHVVALGVGAYLFLAHRITIGTVYMLNLYALRLQGPITELAGQMQSLQQAGASLSRASKLFRTQSALVPGHRDTIPSTDPRTGTLPPRPEGLVSTAERSPNPARSGSPPLPKREGKESPATLNPGESDLAFPAPRGLDIDVDGVSFAYDEDVPVLRDLSFTVAAEATLGLLGRTGSGKTTLTRLLCRLYDPSVGDILLGGVSLRELTEDAVCHNVAVVTQNVQFFGATIRDNLTLFNPAISDRHILDALNELGLSDWLRSLPNGLDTQFDADNAGLSAGEAQLVALTRVFLTDPALVILDEPTARMDPATEHRIEQAFQRLLKGRTGIIIAHRLATVERVDQIMILDEGRILEQGARALLKADPRSHFSRLLNDGLAEVLS